jgi:hypothetical protein
MCLLVLSSLLLVKVQDIAKLWTERALDYYMGGYAIRDAGGLASGCDDVGKAMCVVRALLHALVYSSDGTN